jgi:hypothetical protein
MKFVSAYKNLSADTVERWFLQVKQRRAEKDTILRNVTPCGFVPAPNFLGGLRPSLMILRPLTGLLYQQLTE